MVGFGGKRLQAQFRHAFARAHGVGRAHGFVGGDKHEGADAGFDGSLGAQERTEDVVAYAFDGVELDHRDVFVGGGVIDGFNAVRGHDADQAFFVLYRTKQGYDFDLTAGGCLSFAQFFVYAV